uniref:Uncharacterized protein n=1 Tax=Arundo donax TaxID=35708 RepID=A0A0A9C4C7_ARUDO
MGDLKCSFLWMVGPNKWPHLSECLPPSPRSPPAIVALRLNTPPKRH